MKVKMTNQKIEQNIQALSDISSKVRGKVAYAIARNLRKLTDEIQEFVIEKDNLIKEYGEIDEQGRLYISVDSPRFNEFAFEFEPLLMIEQEIDIYMLKAEELFLTELTGEEIFNISFMVEEELNNGN